MQTFMLKAKLHQACVIKVELHYEGSCAIDGSLLDRAGIREYEQIHLYNLNNGERLVTYAIRAEEGSGLISVNGAAARKANVGDRIILCSYAMVEQAELARFRPCILYLDEHNRVLHSRHAIPVQVAS